MDGLFQPKENKEPAPIETGSGVEDFIEYMTAFDTYQEREEALLEEARRAYHEFFVNKKNESMNVPRSLPEVVCKYDVELFKKITEKGLDFKYFTEKERKNCTYFCSYYDLQTPLLTTNSDVIYCYDFKVSLNPRKLYEYMVALAKSYQKGTVSDLLDPATLEAIEYRREQGHFRTDLDKKANPYLIIANELLSLNIDFESLDIKTTYPSSIDNKDGALELQFNWQHPQDSNTKQRIINFIDLNVSTFTESRELSNSLHRKKKHGIYAGAVDFFILKSGHRSIQNPEYTKFLHDGLFKYIINHCSVCLLGDQFGLESGESTEENTLMKAETTKMAEQFLQLGMWERIDQPNFSVLKNVINYLNSVGYKLPLEKAPTRPRQRTYSWYLLPFISKDSYHNNPNSL